MIWLRIYHKQLFEYGHKSCISVLTEFSFDYSDLAKFEITVFYSTGLFKGMVHLTQDMASDDNFGPPE